MVFRIQPHVRLQEWIAEELGYFEDEGLDHDFDPDGFAGASVTTSTATAVDQTLGETRSGAFEDMEQGRACSISSACHWAVSVASSAAHGRMWASAYSITPSGIFVAPEAPYQRPEDLAGVAVGVGYHSGSHYSAIQGLEGFLGRPEIALGFVGRPYDRARLMVGRRLAAANVFGAQYYLLEQLGFRKLVDTTFMIGFLVAPEADRRDVEAYFRALRRAQLELDLQPERYKHYWLREMPEDLRELADVRRFGPGERIVFEPYTQQSFERTHRWLASWDLLDEGSPPRDLDYDRAVLRVEDA